MIVSMAVVFIGGNICDCGGVQARAATRSFHAHDDVHCEVHYQSTHVVG